MTQEPFAFEIKDVILLHAGRGLHLAGTITAGVVRPGDSLHRVKGMVGNALKRIKGVAGGPIRTRTPMGWVSTTPPNCPDWAGVFYRVRARRRTRRPVSSC